MFADTESGHDFFHTRLKFLHRLIVKMIPVVVRYHQKIDVGHVVRLADISSVEHFVHETNGGSLIKYRIDEHFLSRQIHQIRGMSEPDNPVALIGK